VFQIEICSEQISIWKHQIIDYRDPENKTGVWAGRRLKQRNTRNTSKLGRKR